MSFVSSDIFIVPRLHYHQHYLLSLTCEFSDSSLILCLRCICPKFFQYPSSISESSYANILICISSLIKNQGCLHCKPFIYPTISHTLIFLLWSDHSDILILDFLLWSDLRDDLFSLYTTILYLCHSSWYSTLFSFLIRYDLFSTLKYAHSTPHHLVFLDLPWLCFDYLWLFLLYMPDIFCLLYIFFAQLYLLNYILILCALFAWIGWYHLT